MISVSEARTRIISSLTPVANEIVALPQANGRTLAEDLHASLSQPPVAFSAMDGYAVRFQDLETLPAVLSVIGEAPAGGAYNGAIEKDQAVRIFTGGPVPKGADAIVIQENALRDAETVTIAKAPPLGQYIRVAGLDFKIGELGIRAGTCLGAREIGLAAAMNRPWVCVKKRPRVSLLATGDEVVRPGEPVGQNQIVGSNTLAMAALLSNNGADPTDLGIAMDTRESLLGVADMVKGSDLLITMGGASVGEHDIVKSVFEECGLKTDFWQVAMRPGKPLMFGTFNTVPMLGLPGNPVSSLVCGLIFVLPAIQTLLGQSKRAPQLESAILGCEVSANDNREDYLRAKLSEVNAELVVTPFSTQDSSMLTVLANADCLLLRRPNAPFAEVGETVDIIRLKPNLIGY